MVMVMEHGDNPNGTDADMFPTDATQWSDADGDGYGDNQSGHHPDRFPQDATQWNDTDGDGYGDNPLGHQADAFPNVPPSGRTSTVTAMATT